MIQNQKSLPLAVVAIAVIRDGKLLVSSRRKRDHNFDKLGTPGGKIEPFETIEEAAARELKEETGLVCEHFVKLAFFSPVNKQAGLHYISLYLLACGLTEEPQSPEVEKHGPWEFLEPAEIMNADTLTSIKMFLSEQNHDLSRWNSYGCHCGASYCYHCPSCHNCLYTSDHAATCPENRAVLA